MFDGLRAELDGLGLTPFDVQLPDERVPVAPLEGALRLRATDQGGFLLESVDYGVGYPLGSAETEAAARALLLAYVAQPLPAVQPISRAGLDVLVGRVARHYFDLRDRVRAAGDAGLAIALPPELPVDRVGALDGTEVYPVETPFGLRALGPWSLRPENDVHTFVTATDIPVNAALKRAWFGQPGGGLRFRLAERGLGLRDLVARGALRRVHVID